MRPEMIIHRPRGVLPKVAVERRTVVDYQPSWLLLALPAVAVVRARRRKTRMQAEQPAEATADLADPPTQPSSRWRRPTQVVVFAVPGRRSRVRSGTASTGQSATAGAAADDARADSDVPTAVEDN
jgi:hypothetical protein